MYFIYSLKESGFGYRGILNNINNKGKKSYGYIWKKSRS